jgi:hypothetical protein
MRQPHFFSLHVASLLLGGIQMQIAKSSYNLYAPFFSRGAQVQRLQLAVMMA